MNRICTYILGVATISFFWAASAVAELTNSYQFNGKGNWSIDAQGGLNYSYPIGLIDAEVPVGSTIEKAFLYVSMFHRDTVNQTVPSDLLYLVDPIDPDDDLFVGFDHPNFLYGVDGLVYPDGTVGNFISLGDFQPDATNRPDLVLGAYRADVTSFVQQKYNLSGGATMSFEVNYEFPANEYGSTFGVDGEILVVVYSNPNEEERTIALLDGFSTSGGDDVLVTLDAPLPPLTPGFEALLSLGIGFGFQDAATLDQYSIVDVSVEGGPARRLTSSAGGQDDGIGENSGLITAGGLGDDPMNPLLPFATPNSVDEERSDDELYDLARGNISPAPFLTEGAEDFTIHTENPSLDDNIFFAGINITAVANVLPNAVVPEPTTLALLGLGLGMLGYSRKSRNQR